MKMGAMIATAKSKTVVQDAALRGLGTAILAAGLIGFQTGATLEEKSLGVVVMGVGLLVYVIKDVLKSVNNEPISATSLKRAGRKSKKAD